MKQIQIALEKIKDWFQSLFSENKVDLKKVELPLATCGIMVADEDEKQGIEAKIAKAKPLSRKSANDLYVIPLAIHIIHKGEPIGTGTNISDAQVYSAINGMNEDFSKEPNSNGDGAGVSTPFRFMLINKDDEGNQTTGIYRVNGAELSQAYADHGVYYNGKGERENIFKNWSRQNNQHAYNIWIVSEIGGNNGGSGVQGFAYFPTTSYVDGIVQLYNATGVLPKNWNMALGSFALKSYTRLNRTITHEMGHSLGLFHTFQGNSCNESNCSLQGDRVCDTPPTTMNSNGNYPACGGTQQVENYMDYTSEKYKNMFTAGQRDRMLLAYENSRPNLITSNALDNLNTIGGVVSMHIVSPNKIICPNSDSSLSVMVTNLSDNPIHSIEFEYMINEEVQTVHWHGPIAPQGAFGHDEIGLAKLKLQGTSTINVSIKRVNGNAVNLYDSITVIVPTNEPYKIEILQDVIAGQISWDIVKASNLKTVYESPQYENFKPGELIEHSICLPDGDYIFTLIDISPGMQTQGAYVKLIDNNGNELVNAVDGFSTVQYNFTVTSNKNPDVNNDGYVNILDVSELMKHYGTMIGDANYNELVDLNNDGMINLLDLSYMLKDLNNQISTNKSK